MNIFYRILCKLYNFDLPLKNAFDDTCIFNLLLTDTLLYSYFRMICQKCSDSCDLNELRREKYIQLDTQLKNPFYSSSNTVFIDSFGRANRYYFTLSRFARLWKVKRSPIRIQSDLCGNELDPNKNNCMVVYQNDSLYYFSVSDLLNICKNALLHASYSFVLSPICPKNPYTNIAFTKPILYAIYWKIRKSNYNMPVLLQLYYNTFFDETLFLYKHEPIIRDFYMKDLICMSDEKILKPYIKRMLSEFYLYGPFKFDIDFPAKKLVEIMSPYLRLYFLHKYSISGSDEKYQAYYIIKYKLGKLYESHPTLGRKIYKQKSNPHKLFQQNVRPRFVKTFIDMYIPFHEIKLESAAFDTEEDSEEEDSEEEDNEEEDNEEEDNAAEYDDEEDEIASNSSF